MKAIKTVLADSCVSFKVASYNVQSRQGLHHPNISLPFQQVGSD